MVDPCGACLRNRRPESDEQAESEDEPVLQGCVETRTQHGKEALALLLLCTDVRLLLRRRSDASLAGSSHVAVSEL